MGYTPRERSLASGIVTSGKLLSRTGSLFRWYARAKNPVLLAPYLARAVVALGEGRRTQRRNSAHCSKV